jgi:hypothetical protein
MNFGKDSQKIEAAIHSFLLLPPQFAIQNNKLNPTLETKKRLQTYSFMCRKNRKQNIVKNNIEAGKKKKEARRKSYSPSFH